MTSIAYSTLRMPLLVPGCKMPNAAKLVLSRMLVFSCNDAERVFPCSISYLAGLFSIARQTVINSLSFLTEGEYVFKRISKNGNKAYYQINFNHPDFIKLDKDGSNPDEPDLTQDDFLLSENPPCKTAQDNNLQPVQNLDRSKNCTATSPKIRPLPVQKLDGGSPKIRPHKMNKNDLKKKEKDCSSREGKQNISPQNTTQQNVNTYVPSLSQNSSAEILPHVPGVPPAQQCPKDANECLAFFSGELKSFIAQDPARCVASTLIHWELLAQNFVQYYNARHWRNVTDWKTKARQWAIKEAEHALLDQKRHAQRLAKNAPLPQSTEEYKNNVEAIGQRLYDYFNDPNSFENRMAAERAKKDKDKEIMYLDSDC